MKFKKILMALTVALSIGLLAACEDGPAEDAGEEFDRTVENIQDAADDAGNELEDACEEAKEETGMEDDDC
ncbi:hypothetical protein [Glaciecola sp. 1036]|uniref:hypothetical protein n=1 Tax=Alteromonadaceae TaxID=72275 RepID=UPI003D009488